MSISEYIFSRTFFLNQTLRIDMTSTKIYLFADKNLIVKGNARISFGGCAISLRENFLININTRCKHRSFGSQTKIIIPSYICHMSNYLYFKERKPHNGVLTFVL